MVDDVISTGPKAFREHGASSVHLVATHGLFSNGASATLNATEVASVVSTDSVTPLRIQRQALGERLVVLSVAGLMAEAIRRNNARASLTDLLDRGP